MPTLTVFTPTYNRVGTLPRLFESLTRQTSRDFAWLVIDDGSTDPTKDFVEHCKAVADFDVEYVYQVNGGKHSAINTAVSRARTELFLILDSDDELLPHAVEVIVSAWTNIELEARARIAGIWALCLTPSGEILSGPLPEGIVDASLQELRYVHKIDTDMLRCFVTAVLRCYPFPATPSGSCPYIPEGYIWSRITQKYPIRFLNVPCSKVHYQPMGLSAIARHEYRLSRCVVYGYLMPLTSDLDWFWFKPSFFLESAIQLGRYSLFSGEFWRLTRTLGWKAQALVFGTLPVAILLLAKDWATGRIARQLAFR